MTREEAEEIFIPIVLSDDGGVAKMTAQEFQIFSVFVAKYLKIWRRIIRSCGCVPEIMP
jgi:hypothetical protein